MLRESFEVAAPPEEVIARIKSRASLWRESLVPADLARRGVTGVEVLVEDMRFELRAHPWSSDPPPTDYRFLGAVRALSSGSVVEVEVGTLPVARFGKVAWVLIIAAAAAALYVLGSIAVGIAAVLLGVLWWREHTLARGADPVVEFYFEMLERALDLRDDSVVRYFRATDFSPTASWDIVNWCMARGADEFSLRFMGIEGVPDPTVAEAKRVLAPFQRSDAPRACASVYAHESARTLVPLWRLDPDSLVVLKNLFPDGLFTHPSYAHDGWIEDPVIYRGGALLVGVVSHEDEGFAHARPDDLPSLLSQLPSHERGLYVSGEPAARRNGDRTVEP